MSEANMVELVLEPVRLQAAWELLANPTLIGGTITSFHAPHLEATLSQDVLKSYDCFCQLWDDPNASFVAAFNQIAIPNGRIRDPNIWIRACGQNQYLVEITFYTFSVHVVGKDVQKALKAAASRLADLLSAPSFYMGLEPATDLSTRLFTNDSEGPMSWNDLCEA